MSTIDAPTAAGSPAPAFREDSRELIEARTVGGRPGWRVPLPRPIRRLAGPVLLVVIWQLLGSLGVVSDAVLAPPSAVLAAGWDLARTGELSANLAASLIRAADGLAIGVTVGLALAVLAGLFRLGEDLLDSTMQILRALPVLGLVPLVIIWFGVGEVPKVALVVFATLFPVYINTYAAIRGVDNRLVESGRAFGLGRLGLVRHVILPGAVPGFLVGLRYALTTSWLVLVIAEQLNATTGVGYLMNEAQTWNRTDIIVLGLLIYGMLGLASDALVRLLERRLLVWRRGFGGA